MTGHHCHQPMPKQSLVPFFRNKTPEEFSNLVIETFGEIFQDTTTLRKLLFISKNWRLTKQGYQKLSDKYISFLVTSTEPIILTGNVIIYFDRAANCPWYVEGKNLYVFDSEVALGLEMFSGNIAEYVYFQYDNEN